MMYSYTYGNAPVGLIEKRQVNMNYHYSAVNWPIDSAMQYEEESIGPW